MRYLARKYHLTVQGEEATIKEDIILEEAMDQRMGLPQFAYKGKTAQQVRNDIIVLCN